MININSLFPYFCGACFAFLESLLFYGVLKIEPLVGLGTAAVVVNRTREKRVTEPRLPSLGPVIGGDLFSERTAVAIFVRLACKTKNRSLFMPLDGRVYNITCTRLSYTRTTSVLLFVSILLRDYYVHVQLESFIQNRETDERQR